MAKPWPFREHLGNLYLGTVNAFSGYEVGREPINRRGADFPDIASHV